MGYLKSFWQTTNHRLIHTCSPFSHKNLDLNTSKSPMFILKHKVKLRDSITWLKSYYHHKTRRQDHVEPHETIPGLSKVAGFQWKPPPTWLASARYSAWHFLNKIHVSLDWPLTLITQPSTSIRSDNPESTVCFKHIEALTTKQLRWLHTT